MSSHLGDLLEKLGWLDGFEVPLADEANRQLEMELASLSVRKVRAKNRAEIVSERLVALGDSLRYLAQQDGHNQRLIATQTRHLDQLKNEYHVARAERDNTEAANRNLRKLIKESEERGDQHRADLLRGVATSDRLKCEVEWDSEALRAWEEALAGREDEQRFIEKLRKEDEMSYNLMEAKRFHLQGQTMEMRSKVSRTATETWNYELIVERTGKVLRQLSQERDSLTDRWKETIKVLMQRDSDSSRVQERIAGTLEAIDHQEVVLSEHDSFLSDQRRNNKDAEIELRSLHNAISKSRGNLIELVRHVGSLNSELLTMRRQTASTSQHLENERLRGRSMLRSIEEHEHLQQRYLEEIDKLRDKITATKAASVTSSDKVDAVQRMIDENERSITTIVDDTKKLNGTLYRSELALVEQKTRGKNLSIDVSNAANNCTQLSKMIQVETRNFDKIKEVVYNMEYRIDEIEKKLKRIEDESKQEDAHSDERERRVQELEKTLQEHKEVQHALQNQVDRLQDEMRRLANTISADKESYAVLRDKCENNRLIYDSGLRQLAAAKRSMQERQVEENMVKLHLRQIERERRREERDIFTLEKLRIGLDRAMKERRLIVDSRTTVAQLKRRSLEEDRGRLRSDLAVRRLKIEQIMKKHHLTLMLLGKNDDGQPLSVSHFRIRNAQEKFFLQQKGDELDRKIKTAEGEIVAMENTLKVLNVTNFKFKNSLSLVKENDEEVSEMKSLEEQLEEVQQELRKRRALLASREKVFQDLRAELEVVSKEAELHQSRVNELNLELDSVRSQEADKDEKLGRTDLNLKRTMAKVSRRNVSRFERDLEIRNIKDSNERILSALKDCQDAEDEMTPKVRQYCDEYKVSLPSTRYSVRSYSSSMPSTAPSSSSTSSRSYETQLVSTVRLTPEFQ